MLRARCQTLACFLVLIAAARGFADEPRLPRFEYWQTHMGTRFKIILYTSNARRAARASLAAFQRIARLDATMSDYRETSELNRLSQQSGRGFIKVSDDLLRVLVKSEEIARRTDGAFDITIGPIIRLWRHARRAGVLPDARLLALALTLTGHDKLHIDRKARAVRLDKPGMLLDLGGIAKGFAADEALSVLKRYGISSALVVAGGDIRAGGAPPGARGWKIAVAAPGALANRTEQYLMLKDAAVSTSGDAEQFVEIAGTRYSHIVDPKTGVGIKGQTSVTVVAADCTTSDSLATSASVLGPEKGLELIESTKGAAALFIQADEKDFRAFESTGWKQFLSFILSEHLSEI